MFEIDKFMKNLIRRCSICKARIINGELVAKNPLEDDETSGFDFTDGILSKKCFMEYYPENYDNFIKN